VTAEWFDLGQRFHAATTGKVVKRVAAATVRPVPCPVAVRVRQTGPAVTVTAATPGTGEQTATGTAALDLLAGLGVRMTAGTWRTLVTDSPGTLPALMTLANATTPGSEHADVAAHIAWWEDRQDFPGTTAVTGLAPACQTRWVTGTVPAAERQARTWLAWLGISDSGCAAMLALLGKLQEGESLALLAAIEQDDKRSWAAAQHDFTSGRDWRHPDSAGRAAAGLQSRCDTADLYAAALLTDPLYRLRAVHTGHVVTGTATLATGTGPRRHTLTVTCDRMDTRLRPGTDITGWAGSPADPAPARFTGTVTDAAVIGGALTLTATIGTVHRPLSGSRITLHPAAPHQRILTEGRRRVEQLYGTRWSWLTTGHTPGLERREVPLDVMVAAAGGTDAPDAPVTG
jgi:hypothetical protein